MKKKYFLLVGLALLATSMIYAADPQQVVWNATANPFFANDDGSMPDIQGGRMIWVDFNNDGLKDVFFIGGSNNNNNGAAQSGRVFLYKNNGDGTFTPLVDEIAEIDPLTQTSAEFIDYDNDGNLDLITIGKEFCENCANPQRVTTVYHNTGPEGGYKFVKNNEILMTQDEDGNDVPGTFPALATDRNDANGHQIIAVDVDHDGWTDLIISGFRQIPDTVAAIDDPETQKVNNRLFRIYKNMGGKYFEEQTGNVTEGGFEGNNFLEVSGGAISVGDVNKDGYVDIMSNGAFEACVTSQDIGFMYISNGDGTYKRWDAEHSPLETIFKSGRARDIAFLDIDGDGYSDILEIPNQHTVNLYLNSGDGNNNFNILNIANAFGGDLGNGGDNASIAAGDINNDGLLDIYFQCMSSPAGGKILYNTGNYTAFADAGELSTLARARSGTANLVDINDDGNLDYSACGFADGVNKDGYAINTLVDTNGNAIPSNTPPSAPTSFDVTYKDNVFLLTWSGASDKETKYSALRYNVYAKDIATGKVFMYAPADIATGKLKMGGGGVPLITPTSFDLHLPDGDYTFGVSTVDQADVASEFATFDYSPTGISTNVPNSNAVRAFVSDRAIVIENNMSTASSYSIITPTGQIIATGVCPAGTKQTIPELAQGVYIVKTTETVAKLLVF